MDFFNITLIVICIDETETTRMWTKKRVRYNIVRLLIFLAKKCSKVLPDCKLYVYNKY